MKIDYANRKNLSQEAVDQENLEYSIQETKLDLETQKLSLQRSLSTAEKELASLKTDYPINIKAIYEKFLTVEELKNQLRFVEKLQAEFCFVEYSETVKVSKSKSKSK